MRGGFTNIFKELNLFINPIYFGGTMKHKGFCLLVSKLLYVVYIDEEGMEGWDGAVLL